MIAQPTTLPRRNKRMYMYGKKVFDKTVKNNLFSLAPERYPNLVEHVNKLLINSVSCVNAAAQFAGIAALDGPDDSIKEMMRKFTIRRKLIHDGLNNLPGVECSLPGGAF